MSKWINWALTVLTAFGAGIRRSEADGIECRSGEADSEFWTLKAQDIVQRKLEESESLNLNRARNVILFVGGGMGVQTIAAARMYGPSGAEERQLSFEKFPHFGLSSTFCIDLQVAESCPTALFSGVKSNSNTIGVNGKVIPRSCNLDSSTETESIAKWAQRAGKATGFVTNSRVTDAVSAALYGHSASRFWETDVAIQADDCDSDQIDDLAEQLITGEIGQRLRVVLGGGRQSFRDASLLDEEGRPGARKDGKDLIGGWKSQKKGTEFEYVWNRTSLLNVDFDRVEYLMGLFGHDRLPYRLDVENQQLKEKPSLVELTKAAITLLSKEPRGFFLVVEGALIASAHHEAKTRKVMEEMVDFEQAVDEARKMTNQSDTLIVVTADHSTSMAYSGDKVFRGHDILGIGGVSEKDSLPYTTLNYANGPGYANTYESDGSGRKDISKMDLRNPEFEFFGTVPTSSVGHGGEDVGVYAIGSHSHIFTGSYDQTSIPLLMAYAAEIGPFGKGVLNQSSFPITVLSFTSVLIAILN